MTKMHELLRRGIVLIDSGTIGQYIKISYPDGNDGDPYLCACTMGAMSLGARYTQRSEINFATVEIDFNALKKALGYSVMALLPSGHWLREAFPAHHREAEHLTPFGALLMLNEDVFKGDLHAIADWLEEREP